jgi:hypothetical protein
MSRAPRRSPISTAPISAFARAFSLLAIGAGCTGVRTIADPMLLIQTPGGSELGVSTDYGVAFLGRTAQAGNVQITVWFGDGPQTESTAIEPVGGGIFTAEMEIRLPEVSMNFVEPKPGDEVLVIGRHGGRIWQRSVRVKRDPRVDGLILPALREVENAPDQVGAGVFVEKEGQANPELVGLVSGVLALTEAGGTQRYVTVVGMRDLWRLVAHRRELDRKRPRSHREDVQ